MFVHLLLLLANMVAATMVERLEILIHRVKGSRMRHVPDVNVVELAENMIDHAYTGLPSVMVNFHKVCIRMKMLLRNQTLAGQQFMADFKRVRISKEPMRRKMRQLSDAANRYKSAQEEMYKMAHEFTMLKHISENVVLPPEDLGWEDVSVQYFKTLEFVITEILALSPDAISIDGDARRLGTALSAHLQYQRSLEDKLKETLKAILRKEIGTILPQLLLAHYQLDLVMIQTISAKNAPPERVQINHVIRDMLDEALVSFELLAASPDWENYREILKRFREDVDGQTICGFLNVMKIFQESGVKALV